MFGNMVQANLSLISCDMSVNSALQFLPLTLGRLVDLAVLVTGEPCDFSTAKDGTPKSTNSIRDCF